MEIVGKRGKRGKKGNIITESYSSEVIALKPAAGRPPGMTFLGAQPLRAMVRLGSPKGPLAQVIVNSGSNITLVSSKLLKKLSLTPKPQEGHVIISPFSPLFLLIPTFSAPSGRSDNRPLAPLPSPLLFRSPRPVPRPL